MAKKASEPKKTVPTKKVAVVPKAAAKPTKRVSWLDDKAEVPVIETYARQLESFVRTMADGQVDDGEIKAQEKRLVTLIKEVEPLLNNEQHEKVTRLLCELTAYDLMQMTSMIQSLRPVTKFRG